MIKKTCVLGFILIAITLLLPSCTSDCDLTYDEAESAKNHFTYDEPLSLEGYHGGEGSLEGNDHFENDAVSSVENYITREESPPFENSFDYEEVNLTEIPEVIITEYHSIIGTIVSIDGINDESWIAPEYIDWLNFKIECDDNRQHTVIALRETVRHGEIKVGNKITVYWLVDSPVFVCDMPIHVAAIIVAEGVEYEPAEPQFIWQFFYVSYLVSSLWPDSPIVDFDFPNVYSRDMFEVLQLPIIAYGRQLEEWAIILDDGTIMVPLQSAIGATAMGVITIGSDDFAEGSLFINVQDGSMAGIRHLAVGSTKVRMSGARPHMCTAPIIVEGIVYVPLLGFFRDMNPFFNTTAEIFEDRLEIMYLR